MTSDDGADDADSGETTVDELEELLNELAVESVEDLYEVAYAAVEMPGVRSASIDDEDGILTIGFPDYSRSHIERVLFNAGFEYSGVSAGQTRATAFVKYGHDDVDGEIENEE